MSDQTVLKSDIIIITCHRPFHGAQTENEKSAKAKRLFFPATVTQLSGSGLRVEAPLKPPDSVDFAALLREPLTVSQAATDDTAISKSPSADAAPQPSPPSLPTPPFGLT